MNVDAPFFVARKRSHSRFTAPWLSHEDYVYYFPIEIQEKFND